MSDLKGTFHNLVYSGKITLVIALIALSFINGHKDFVEKNPRSFMVGCMGFAILMAIGSALVAANRKGGWGNAAFITFLFFFFYAVTREFSGYYALMSGGKEATQNEGKERKILVPIGVAIAGIGLVVGGYLANKIRESPPTPDQMRFMRFPVELLVFVAIGTFAETFVSRQHGDKSISGATMSAVVYIIAHLYLQYGGFYDHAFAPVNFNKFA
jgi:hypothetical protein